jgi:hypothetical protein
LIIISSFKFPVSASRSGENVFQDFSQIVSGTPVSVKATGKPESLRLEIEFTWMVNNPFWRKSGGTANY